MQCPPTLIYSAEQAIPRNHASGMRLEGEEEEAESVHARWNVGPRVAGEGPLERPIGLHVPPEVPTLVRAVFALDARETNLHLVRRPVIDAIRPASRIVELGELDRELEGDAVEQTSAEIPLGESFAVVIAEDLETIPHFSLVGHDAPPLGYAVWRPIQTAVRS